MVNDPGSGVGGVTVRVGDGPQLPVTFDAAIQLGLCEPGGAADFLDSGAPWRDGTMPVLLYGYGSYGMSMPAGFRTSILSLVDRGFIYAIAHVRGGTSANRDLASRESSATIPACSPVRKSRTARVSNGYDTPLERAGEGVAEFVQHDEQQHQQQAG